MKRFALAVALACVLSGTTLAGDAHSVGAPEAAPSTPSSSVVVTVILTLISLVRWEFVYLPDEVNCLRAGAG